LAVVIINEAGGVDQSNRAAQALFGYTESEFRDLHGEQLVEAAARPRLAMLRRRMFADATDPAPTVVIERTGLHKDGRTFPLESIARRVVAEHGPVLVCCVSDISRRRNAEARLRHQHDELRRLTARLVAAQEDTAREIARELHDVTSQKLAALAMRLAELENAAAAGSSPRGLARDCRTLADELARDVHDLARQTHPAILDDLGLAAALRAECRGTAENFGIPVEFIEHDVPASLPGSVSLALYRIAQEAIRNVRHAAARAIRVELRMDGRYATLRIQDEGDGFDLKAAAGRRGLGLVSMRERAAFFGGTLTVHSEIGVGTVVKARIPVLEPTTP
jgi:PAS domain S-box-containing protein